MEVVAVPAERFSLHRSPSTFTNEGDSGRKLHRHFCPRCGTTMMVEAKAFPGMALVMGGTLDDTAWLRPTMALFYERAQPWLEDLPEMKAFARMPSQGQRQADDPRPYVGWEGTSATFGGDHLSGA